MTRRLYPLLIVLCATLLCASGSRAPSPLATLKKVAAPRPSSLVTTAGPTRVERAVPEGIRVQPPSLIERQESFYAEAFHEYPARRRRWLRTWNRNRPESEIIGRDRELYLATKVLLAKVCFHESNWICDPRREQCGIEGNRNTAQLDCPAIYRVLRTTRRTGETLLGAMRRHSPRVSEVRETHRARTRWVIALGPDARRPRGFPSDLNWRRDYAERWTALLALADRLLRGIEPEGCSRARLLTWGGRCEDAHGACDDHVAIARGLRRADCGPTSNAFWCAEGDCPESAPVSDTRSAAEPSRDGNEPRQVVAIDASSGTGPETEGRAPEGATP